MRFEGWKSFTSVHEVRVPSAANVLSSVSAAGPTTITTAVTTIVEAPSEPAQTQTQNPKANALLDSMLDSIESPRVGPVSLTPQSSMQSQGQDIPESSAVSEGMDSPTKRNRDLADALFGPQDTVDVTPPPSVLHIPYHITTQYLALCLERRNRDEHCFHPSLTSNTRDAQYKAVHGSTQLAELDRTRGRRTCKACFSQGRGCHDGAPKKPFESKVSRWRGPSYPYCKEKGRSRPNLEPEAVIRVHER
jgi:hypothetical protein